MAEMISAMCTLHTHTTHRILTIQLSGAECRPYAGINAIVILKPFHLRQKLRTLKNSPSPGSYVDSFLIKVTQYEQT